MGFKIEVSGMEELILQMDKLEDKGRGVAAQALYEGAGVVADAVSSAVNSIATEEFHYTKFGTRMPSPEEKACAPSTARPCARRTGKSWKST